VLERGLGSRCAGCGIRRSSCRRCAALASEMSTLNLEKALAVLSGSRPNTTSRDCTQMRDADPNQQRNNSRGCSVQARVQVGPPGTEQRRPAQPPSRGLNVRSRQNHGRPHRPGKKHMVGSTCGCGPPSAQRARIPTLYILPGQWVLPRAPRENCTILELDAVGASCLELRRLSTRRIRRRMCTPLHVRRQLQGG
jgi:hypothetical protein